MIAYLKDGFLAAACSCAKLYVNSWSLKGVGKMLRFVVCSEKKTVEASIMLEGEKEPLDVSVGRYEFNGNGSGGDILLKDMHTSRAWLNNLIESLYPDGVPISVNSKVFSILSKSL